jgi:hypothetical protein
MFFAASREPNAAFLTRRREGAKKEEREEEKRKVLPPRGIGTCLSPSVSRNGIASLRSQ